MAPVTPRFQVELRCGGRIVTTASCGTTLVIGEGGGLVVPGLGGEVTLVQDGRVLGGAGLVGESDGVRGRWIVEKHPELEITIEPLEAIAIERGRTTMIPTRETMVAAALACCLAGLFGRTAIAGTLVEPEQEIVPEETAITLAIQAAPIPERVFVPPPIRFVAIAPPIVPEVDPTETAAPLPSTQIPVAPAQDLMATKTVEPAPKKRRRGKPRAPEATLWGDMPSDAGVLRVLGSSDAVISDTLVGIDSIEAAMPSLEGSAQIDEAIGGPGGVPGGVPGTGAIDEFEPTPKAWAVPIDATSDPFPDGFTLADAFAGHASLADDKAGKLTALLHTSKGTIRCELFEDRAPRTVANFVGLALGTRPSLDPESSTWRSRKLYTDTQFHRVVAGFVIQGGDPLGTGKGGPGYTIPDEIDPDLDHDAAGVLSMANRGPNTGGSQFFVTLGAAPHIDGTSTVFGRCDLDAVRRIGEVEVDAHARPLDPVTLRRVEIVRTTPPVEGPAAEIAVPSEPSSATDVPSTTTEIEPPDPTG